MIYGTKKIAGLSQSMVIATMDFETYSEAGYPGSKTKRGLTLVGATVYAQHHSTRVLSLAYDLKNGSGVKLWRPFESPPEDLFNHLEVGLLIESHNSFFEYVIWNFVCVDKYFFPPLHPQSLRCSAAKARAFGLPGSLEHAGSALNLDIQKDKKGKQLIQRYCVPSRYSTNEIDPALYEYNIRDVESESELSELVPDLNDFELLFWQIDQRINHRGIGVDIKAIDGAIKIINYLDEMAKKQIYQLTDGVIKSPTEIGKITKWLIDRGVKIDKLDDSIIADLLQSNYIPDYIKDVLRIRQDHAYASARKVFAMKNRIDKSGRITELFVYHKAHTGRAAGAGVQAQNLPNSGPDVFLCKNCSSYYQYADFICCENPDYIRQKWSSRSQEYFIQKIRSGISTSMELISSCMRGFFSSAEGCDLICSDYSAIEAVVIAELAEESWRQKVFRTHGKIYEMSAAKITGLDFSEFLIYSMTNKEHHPNRRIGKVAELASAYQGSLGAWKKFGADKFLSDAEIMNSVKNWRQSSPAVVALWGGLEDAARCAILNPGREYCYKSITYTCRGHILYCRLPSSRYLTYHQASIDVSQKFAGATTITYKSWQANRGPKGARIETYGGRLTENVVQAVARDILAHAIVQLENRGYPIVLHVHDEIVAEVREGQGSIEEFEMIMSSMPSWATTWPIHACGGWRAKRYSK